jgi:hypothetical protein
LLSVELCWLFSVWQCLNQLYDNWILFFGPLPFSVQLSLPLYSPCQIVLCFYSYLSCFIVIACVLFPCEMPSRANIFLSVFSLWTKMVFYYKIKLGWTLHILLRQNAFKYLSANLISFEVFSVTFLFDFFYQKVFL